MVQPIRDTIKKRGSVKVLERAALGVDGVGRICYFKADEEEKDEEEGNEEDATPKRVEAQGEEARSAALASSHLVSCQPPPPSLRIVTLPPSHFLLPGLVDTHLHAPQFGYTGTATHLPLLEWLNRYTFPSEARLASDLSYAQSLYRSLLDTVVGQGTTTALYFASKDLAPTKLLVDLIHAKGQRGFVGKVNMDRHAPEDYCEASASASLAATEAFLDYVLDVVASPLVRPVLTPRFLPTCSDALLQGLGALARKYAGREGGREGGRGGATPGLHIQSHISESADQVAFNHRLAEHHQGESRDLPVFERCGLLTPLTVLAHGIHLSPSELALLARRGAGLAHCPLSNFFFGHGVLPVRKVLEAGVKVGLGTDVAGGYSSSMLSAIRSCVLASRALEDGVEEWRHGEEEGDREGKKEGGKQGGEQWCKEGREGMRIDWKEALWLATMGGAECLGLEEEVGSWAVGKAFDAVRVDVKKGGAVVVLEGGGDSAEDLVEKWVNNGDDRHVLEVYVVGREIKHGGWEGGGGGAGKGRPKTQK
ncbi:guanine deaminase [Nannochloropsis gaditana]|uniref:Guanine deaminase n=1 Tax=Nannochloropsis gaditana TaxID=72520 RepID=W7TUS9_9STRA|nr:guanine deaminase [Nannochloropsis gaditana]